MKSCLVALLIFLFIIIYVPFVDFINYKYTIFSPNFYKKLMRENKVYDKINENIPQLLGLDNSKNPLTGMLLTQVVKAAASPAFLQKETEALIDKLPLILNGKNLDAAVSITDYKENLLKNLGVDANLPICSGNQQSANLNCLPINLAPGNKSQANQNPQNLNQAVPNQINLADYATGLKKIAKYYHAYKISIVVMPILLVLIILGLIWLSWPSIKLALKRIGTAMLVASILLVLYSLAVKFLLGSSLLFKFISSKLDILNSPAIKDTLAPITAAIFKGYSSNLLIFSFVSTGLAIVLLVVAAFLPKPKDSAPAQPAPAPVK